MEEKEKPEEYAIPKDMLPQPPQIEIYRVYTDPNMPWRNVILLAVGYALTPFLFILSKALKKPIVIK